MPTTNGSENTAAKEQDIAVATVATPVGDSGAERADAASATEERPKQRHSGYALNRELGGLINCETGLPTTGTIIKLITERRDRAREKALSARDKYDAGYHYGYVSACGLLLHLLDADD